MIKPPPQIKANARPVRVAYVVENGADVHPWLDTIFSECFGRHGGRQTLIVPVCNGEFSDKYLFWLNHFDPDVLLLATYQDKTLAESLTKTFLPLSFQSLDRKQGEEEKRLRVHLPSAALTSLSWLPFLKIRSGAFRERPSRILDCYPGWKDDGLITDNFGTLQHSFDRFPLHRELADQVRPVVLTPQDAPSNRWHFRIEGDEATDAYEVLDAFGSSGHTVSLAYLSNIYSKHLQIYQHPWIRAFCLIVGDTFEDRVCCWNSGLLFDDAQQQPYKSLRVPAGAISNAVHVEHIAKFLMANNWIGQSNSPARITVRSFSLDESVLNSFIEHLRLKSGSFVNYERIGSVDDCCPRKEDEYWPPASFERAQVEIPLRHDAEIVSVPQPLQLEHANFAHPICSTGQWMVDCQIDRLQDNNRFANRRDVWNLPRQKQILSQFFEGGECRVTNTGSVSALVDRKKEHVQIKQPEDSDFFRMLLHQKPTFDFKDLRSNVTYPIHYKWSQLSDKGQYLRGVLGMFQTLARAHEVLACHFWRNQLIKLAMPAEDQYPGLIVKLKKRLSPQAGQFHIDSPEKWERLARVVARQAFNLRSPRSIVKLQFLLDEWRKELTAAIDSNKQLTGQREELLAEADSELKSSLDGLCELGIFHQGYSWKCRHCGYRNWNAIDALGAVLSCQVCHQERRMPVDVTLDLRLNEFLATCLREHDTLPVIGALGELQSQAETSFIFSPQIALFRKYPDSKVDVSDHELDLLCIVDGRFIIGEVKTSLSEIDTEEIKSLVTLAKELRPDVVVIAALESEKSGMDKKLKEIRSQIPNNIETKGLSLSEMNNEPSYFLP